MQKRTAVFAYGRSCRSVIQYIPEKSDDSLCLHGIGNLLESGDVGACNIVAFHSVTLCCFIHILEDIVHDSLQHGIDLFEGPGETL